MKVAAFLWSNCCMEFLQTEWCDDLKRIRPVIKNIFYKGNIDLIKSDRPRLAVVGSRRVTDYGVRVIEKWMPELIDAGVIIVSGFMYGVDQVAHKACLENGGKTIAVLGWGIDRRPADSDVEIYEKIIENDSLILSEYEGETGGEKWTFPQRNRIVAGISDAVLVVEAALGSGSLITAKLANKFDIPLLVVPGQITSRVAEGTNELIKSGKGRMVTGSGDVLEAMGLKAGQMKLEMKNEKDPILILLSESDRSIDEIARLIRATVPEVLGKLTTLSLKGLICERNGKIGLS